MQLGGIGSNHGTGSHQVTNCMHQHTPMQKTGSTGAMTSEVSAQAAQLQAKQQQQTAQFSLSAWVQKLLGSGKNFFGGIWGTNQTSSDGAAERAAVQVNPYFQELSANNITTRVSTFQRLRAKVKGVAGQLTGKLAGRFFRFQEKNSFQAKSEQRPNEDLRKRSKYRKDEVEIDCILTDESYLMDSYDRKGEYSRLSTKK